MVIVIMGTTGAGKTTVGRELASRIGWQFADGDDYHPPANLEKMRNNVPLDDEDRAPWLQSLANAISFWSDSGQDTILACSALKRRYRDQLAAGRDVVFVYLKGSFEQIEGRLSGRKDHFARHELLASQFEALEEPAPDENVLTLDVTEAPEVLAAQIERRLALLSTGDAGAGRESGEPAGD